MLRILPVAWLWPMLLLTLVHAQTLDKAEIRSEIDGYLDLGQYTTMAEKAQHYLSLTHDESLRAFLFMSLGNAHAYQSQLAEAEAAYTAAKQSYLLTGDTLKSCEVDGNLAGLKWVGADISAALSTFNSVLECAEHYQDLNLQAQVFNGKGGIFMFLGNYEEALLNLFEALRISEAQGDTLRIGTSFSNIGSLYQIRGLHREAIEFNEKAVAIFKQKGDQRLMGRTLYNIGSIHLEQDNYSAAIKFLDDAEVLLHEAGDREGLTLVLSERSRVFIATQETDSAKKTLNQALKLASPYSVNEINILNLMSELEMNLGNLASARSFANDALSKSRSQRFIAQTMEAYNLLYRINKLEGRYKEALTMKELYSLTRDSIRNDSHAMEMTTFKAKYEYLKIIEADSIKAHAIQTELQLQVEVAEQRRRTMLTGASASVGILFLLAFGMYRRRMHQTRLEAQKRETQFKEELITAAETVQENERKRIARDLHDEFAGTLSAARLSVASIPSVDNAQKEKLQFVKSQLTESIETVRRISKDLLPPTLEQFGLPAALKDYASTIERASGVTFETELDDGIQRLEPHRELALFRLVQEMTNNALKHAEASKFTLHYTRNGDVVRLYFKDNGKGFDYETLRQSPDKGLGLKNLINRANRAKGVLRYYSEPGGGTEAEIMLNLTHKP